MQKHVFVVHISNLCSPSLPGWVVGSPLSFRDPCPLAWGVRMERCSNGFPGGASNVGGEGDSVESFEEQFAEFLQSNIRVGAIAEDSPSFGASGSAVACVDTETQRETFPGFDFYFFSPLPRAPLQL